MSECARHAAWKALLDDALRAIDTLPPGCPWSWGGGTALAVQLDHRESDDIDIFVTDSNALRALSPQRNPVVRSIARRWQAPGHYLKLERPEGEIDFIVSAVLTTPGIREWPHGNRSLPLETATEILAKKLHWRGSRTLARDVFDLAAAWQFEPSALEAARTVVPDGGRRVADHIRSRGRRLARELPLAIRPTPKGRAVLETDLLALAAELDP